MKSHCATVLPKERTSNTSARGLPGTLVSVLGEAKTVGFCIDPRRFGKSGKHGLKSCMSLENGEGAVETAKSLARN